MYSSQLSVRTDDKLKDEDNAGWLLTLPETERTDWLAVLKWIRLPDRLLEREALDGIGANCRFKALAFQQEYWTLVNQDLALATQGQ